MTTGQDPGQDPGGMATSHVIPAYIRRMALKFTNIAGIVARAAAATCYISIESKLDTEPISANGIYMRTHSR